MMKKISNAIVNSLSHNGSYNDTQKEQMVYALHAILNDVSKTLLLFIVFYFMGYGTYFIVTAFITILLRLNIGGFHMKGYLTCLIFSAVYFFGVLFLYLTRINNLLLATTVMACLLVQFLVAPVSTPQREALKNINKKAFKYKAMAISATVLLAHIIINNPYTKISMWVVIIQTLFIMAYKGVKNYEKIC